MHHQSFTPFLMLLLVPIAIAVFVLILKFVIAKMGGAKFKFRTPLLTAPEQNMYRRLVEALPEHVVLAQVAFSQMITVEGGSREENFRKFGTARQKVADFVICDSSFKVIAVIELDDSSHSAAKDAMRDEIINEAGSKTIRWRATKQPSPNDIRHQVLGT
ncbi:MAG: DUF2726 domain-containing protein [Fimbriimonadaceae bacterium]